ncbi:RNA-binding S4 domain-containing protein [Desulfobacterota bacterium M19]
MKVRIDKWLWAARFFKTRSLAMAAVSGGKVHVNAQRVKPARIVCIGDELRIQKGGFEFVVVVNALNDKRRPAREACLLYEEKAESAAARQELREQRRLLRAAVPAPPPKRPGKRDRRLIKKFIRKD